MGNGNFLTRFIEALYQYDKTCEMRGEQADQKVQKLLEQSEQEKAECLSPEQVLLKQFGKELEEYFEKCDKAFEEEDKALDGERHAVIAKRKVTCQDIVSEIAFRTQNMYYADLYKDERQKTQGIESLKLADILHDDSKMNQLIANAQNNVRKTKKFKKSCKELAEYERGIYNTVGKEVARLNQSLFDRADEIEAGRLEIIKNYEDEWKKIQGTTNSIQSSAPKVCIEEKQTISQKTTDEIAEINRQGKKGIDSLRKDFNAQYNPENLREVYSRFVSEEPDLDNYKCSNKNPESIKIGELMFDLKDLQLGTQAEILLRKNYYFMQKFVQRIKRQELIQMPYTIAFDSNFNLLFSASNEEEQKIAVDYVNRIVMRLFMMIPPNKVNFTFLDPVKLGDSFVAVNQLVDFDDRSSKVINGKIWSSSSDIADKLQVAADRISNVNQRCLQGKYATIQEYNKAAGKNAEAYHVIVANDFPAGFSDKSLHLLENIINVGAKCGVFVILIQTEEQQNKEEMKRYQTLLGNIEKGMLRFTSKGAKIFADSCQWKNKKAEFVACDALSQEEFKRIVPVLKKGIKDADKITISVDEMQAVLDNTSESKQYDGYGESSEKCLRVPIGVRGANDIQYLTLGGDSGAFHALVAGITGSGKSSLLHTIILRSLQQYSPDELQIYLVDFKRGVEFKIYAEYRLPAFRVVAIESEREFGYNVLDILENEQKERAKIYKREKVDSIEEYRKNTHKKMPRILVIMDEVQELFAATGDDYAKKSASIVERIVRQGRVFGIHLILASQSYSNISGLNKSIIDQMAVRIVLKCSKSDADMMLDDGETEINQISVDEPGRAVYNSAAGSRNANIHFRIAYIPPELHSTMLKNVSQETEKYYDPKKPTKIMLTNIEDNEFSVFKQFENFQYIKEIENQENVVNSRGLLYLGDSLKFDNVIINLDRKQYSNLLIIGEDKEKARTLFTFAILSVCINYVVWKKSKGYEKEIKPFVDVLDYNPVKGGALGDYQRLVAGKWLSQYSQYIQRGEEQKIEDCVIDLYQEMQRRIIRGILEEDLPRFLFVFGYHNSEELHEEREVILTDESQSEEGIAENDPFAELGFAREVSRKNSKKLFLKDMFLQILKEGGEYGIHVIVWQDSFKTLDEENRDLISCFYKRIAFEMDEREMKQFIRASKEESELGENSILYYDRKLGIERIRPYQTPDENWLEQVCKKIAEK